jgi:hypothetical protein
MRTCRSNIEETRNSCDEKKDAGMNSVANNASQITVMMGQMSSSSIQSACSKMAGLTQAANAALAAYRINCSMSLDSCTSACTAAKSFASQNAGCLSAATLMGNDIEGGGEGKVAEAEAEIRTCQGFKSNVAQATQAIQNYMSTAANASQCEALNNGTGAPPAAVCAANPNYPGCAGAAQIDCSKPEFAATNKVCICARNPNDPQCSSAQKAGGGVAAGSGTVDSGSRLANKGDGYGSDGGDIPGLPGIAQGKPNSGGSEGGVDGQQGSGSPLSGGGGGSGGGPGGRSGGSGGGQEAAALAGGGGFYGGGGSGGRYGGGGSASGSGGAQYGAGMGAANPGTGAAPDLRKFLPGGQYDPKRGISGMGGPDGITGPHTNIWQKIQNRYQVMRSTLLP